MKDTFSANRKISLHLQFRDANITSDSRAMNYGKVSEGWIENMRTPPAPTDLHKSKVMTIRPLSECFLTDNALFIYFYMVKPVIYDSKYKDTNHVKGM
jgi:hypothetical protein